MAFQRGCKYANYYGYVLNDPINFIDPMGLLSIVTTGGVSSTPIKGYGVDVDYYGTTSGSNGSGENGFIINGSETMLSGSGLVSCFLCYFNYTYLKPSQEQ